MRKCLLGCHALVRIVREELADEVFRLFRGILDQHCGEEVGNGTTVDRLLLQARVYILHFFG